jgi:hypothetical protein
MTNSQMQNLKKIVDQCLICDACYMRSASARRQSLGRFGFIRTDTIPCKLAWAHIFSKQGRKNMIRIYFVWRLPLLHFVSRRRSGRFVWPGCATYQMQRQHTFISENNVTFGRIICSLNKCSDTKAWRVVKRFNYPNIDATVLAALARWGIFPGLKKGIVPAPERISLEAQTAAAMEWQA